MSFANEIKPMPDLMTKVEMSGYSYYESGLSDRQFLNWYQWWLLFGRYDERDNELERQKFYEIKLAEIWKEEGV